MVLYRNDWVIIKVAPRTARFGYVRKTRPQEPDVAVALLGNELERLRVVDGLELLA
jgi:hypothetical protein